MNVANLLKINLMSLDIDRRIALAKQDGPLTYYQGDLKDYAKVLEHLLKNQCLVDNALPIPQRNPRHGGFSGDYRDPSGKGHDQTFDEGCQAKAICLMLALWVNSPALRNVQIKRSDGLTLTLGAAINNAMNCLTFAQFWMVGGLPFSADKDSKAIRTWGGLPGFWPQAPGWKLGECFKPTVAMLRTMNDGIHFQNVEALMLHEHVFGGATHSARILMASEGLWAAQLANDGWACEQYHPQGEPAWGREHEPPAWSPRSTMYACLNHTLVHAYTGQEKYLDRAYTSASKVIGMAKTANGREYDHFLEPKTLRVIWGDKDRPYEVTYHDWKAKSPNPTLSYEVSTAPMLDLFHIYLKEIGDV